MLINTGYQLEILEGKDKGKTFPLNYPEITLGRRLIPGERIGGWLLLSEPTVSRIHAVLSWDEKSGKFTIHHRSKTNPTLVNNKSVKKQVLSTDDRIQMGLLVCRIIKAKERVEEPPMVKTPPVKSLTEVHLVSAETGFVLNVVEGQDRGSKYKLGYNRIILGRREGLGDSRSAGYVLLNDEGMPREHLLLTWKGKEGVFSVSMMESSGRPVKLVKRDKHVDRVYDLGGDLELDFSEGDRLIAGFTVLGLEREEPSKVLPPLIEPEPSKKEETIVVEPSPVPPTSPAPVPKAEEAAPVRIRRSLFGPRPEKTMTSKPKPSQRPVMPSPQEIMEEPLPSFGEQTSLWRYRADFILAVLEGKSKGVKFSFFASDIEEAKPILFGSKGERLNDIEIDDETLDNRQGALIFREGKLYLRNDSSRVEISIGNVHLKEGEEALLKTGHRITSGGATLLFLERKVMEKLMEYEVEVLEGPSGYLGKRFDLLKEKVVIGRGKVSDIQIVDREISRSHALITFRHGKFYLEHRSEINPTFLNGVSMLKGQERLLSPGDRIRLSSNTLVVFRSKDGVSSPEAAV